MLFAVVTGCITVLVMSGSGQTLVAESSAIEVTRLREATVDGRDLLATKLESADFMSAFNTLFDRSTSKPVVPLRSDSVANL